jgi:hypothetical protein
VAEQRDSRPGLNARLDYKMIDVVMGKAALMQDGSARGVIPVYS